MEETNEMVVETPVVEIAVEVAEKPKEKRFKRDMTNLTHKTESLKVIALYGVTVFDLKKLGIQYFGFYNCCSDLINVNLTTMKIGDLYEYIPDKSKGKDFAQLLISDEWKDKPLYKIFSKKYFTQGADMALEYFYKANVEIPETEIHTTYSSFWLPCMHSLNANYRTKLQQFDRVNITKDDITEDSEHDVLLNQCVRDVSKYKITKVSEYEDFIKSCKKKEKVSQDFINRETILCKFYKEHTDEVNDTIEKIMCENLQKMGGCHREYDGSFLTMLCEFRGTSIKGVGRQNSMDITKIGKYIYHIDFKNMFSVDVYSRRDIDNGDETLIDITDKTLVRSSIVFKIQNDELYINLQCIVPFKGKVKPIEEIDDSKKIGCDVNIKHMMLMFSENIKNLKGIPNIYAELVKNKEFKSLCTDEEYKYYVEFSKWVCVCPIELPLLINRGKDNREGRMEAILSNVIRDMAEKSNLTNHKESIYLYCVLKIRQQLFAAYSIRNAFNRLNGVYTYNIYQKYDNDAAKEYILAHPFGKTEQGKQLLTKRRRNQNTIDSCRENIQQFTYSILEKCGYENLVLENLTDSGIKNEYKTRIPFPESLLGSKKYYGMSEEDVLQQRNYWLIKDGYMTLSWDDDNCVDGAALTEKGKMTKMRNDFHDIVCKGIHLAGIKDYFIMLQNNGSVSVGLVNNEYTSQMDSIEHKMYFKDKNTLCDKKDLRKTQERHINGKLADLNAANNIEYFASKSCFENFLKPKKFAYCTPAYTPIKTGNDYMRRQFMKFDMQHIVGK